MPPRKDPIMDIMETIKGILAENLDIAPEGISDASTFDSLGIDSLDLVALICDLEEKCSIDFGDPEGLETIGDLIAYVEGLQAT